MVSLKKQFFGGNVIEYDFQNAKKYDLDVNAKEI